MIAWLPDEPMLYDKLTPLEYLEFVAGLWGVEAEARAARGPRSCCSWLGLWEERGQRCEGFSRGMKQKAALAGALIHDPRLLILDEPLTGLDAAVARQVKDLLQAAYARRRHRDPDHPHPGGRRAVADRIGIIQHGRLLAEGTLDELRVARRRRASPRSRTCSCSWSPSRPSAQTPRRDPRGLDLWACSATSCG